MSQSRHGSSIDRRTFLKLSSAGAIVAAAGTAVAQDAAPAVPPKLDPTRQRILGRTGLTLSVVSLGAMRTSESAVMQAAFDHGVNYIDTAYTYMEGQNERIVGEALKGYRDKVLVATKINSKADLLSKEQIIASLEESLKRMGIDHVDLVQLHHPDKETLAKAEPKEALAQLKKDGKTRFVGLTTHKDEAVVMNAVADDPDKFYDMVLTTYHYKSPQEVKDAVARLAKANVGVIAMKTQQGGYQTDAMGGVSPHQAALKFVLADPNITAAIPSMVDLAQVEENTAVIGTELTKKDVAVLEQYNDAIKAVFCHRCGKCSPTCPLGVDIATANRVLMYAEGYRDMALARSTYAEIPAACSPEMCAICMRCVARCENGLDIGAKMERTRRLMA